MSEIEPNKNEEPLSRPTRSRFNFSNTHFEVPSQEAVEKHEPKSHEGRHHQKIHHAVKSGPLIFNVAQLLRDHEGATRDHEYAQDQLHLSDPLDEEDTSRDITHIKGHIRFTKVRHEILAKGSGSAEITLNCVRCLNDYLQPLDYEIEEVFQPSIDIITGVPAKLEVPEAEADLKIDSNHLLDLGEAIRQQVLVSLPMQPLCRADCPGLYQYLDKVNEDYEEPQAEVEEVDPPADPRWATLSKLKVED
ncbi:MAG: DUF177 domain-containing protein [Chloroflexi bacterium]|nr:DUF177 domain-containing protein [Chloroflexota bacterium]